MTDTAQLVHDHWAQIGRTLAIKRGEDWDEALPEELHFRHSNGVTHVRFGDDLFYSLDPDTNQVYESRREADGVLVSIFDEDGELRQASTPPLDKFNCLTCDSAASSRARQRWSRIRTGVVVGCRDCAAAPGGP